MDVSQHVSACICHKLMIAFGRGNRPGAWRFNSVDYRLCKGGMFERFPDLADVPKTERREAVS